MSQTEKMILSLLSGAQDKSFLFADLQTILSRLGFQGRIKGDHFIYRRADIEEIINIQPAGKLAKPYQVKQVRNLILQYRLGGSLHEI